MKRLSAVRSTVLVALLALSLLAAGCGGQQAPAPAAPAPAADAPAAQAPAAQAPAAPAPAAQAPAAQPAAPPATVHVKLGMLPPSISNAGLYIAEAQGYFKEQGIEVEALQFRSGDDQAAALATSEIDIGSGGPNAGLYNSILRGVGTKVVADKGYASTEMDYQAIMVRKDLYDSGIRSIDQLKGRKIGVIGFGASQDLMLSRLISEKGWQPEDVEMVVVPLPQMTVALANKAVDFAFLIEPWLLRAVEQDLGVPIYAPADTYPDQQVAVIFYSEKFAAQQPDAAKRFMIAYLKGVRDYNDAFRKGINKDRVVQILVETQVAEDAATLDRMHKASINPNGYVFTENLQWDIDFFHQQGRVSGALNVDQVVDHSYVDHAIQMLGRYE